MMDKDLLRDVAFRDALQIAMAQNATRFGQMLTIQL